MAWMERVVPSCWDSFDFAGSKCKFTIHTARNLSVARRPVLFHIPLALAVRGRLELYGAPDGHYVGRVWGVGIVGYGRAVLPLGGGTSKKALVAHCP